MARSAELYCNGGYDCACWQCVNALAASVLRHQWEMWLRMPVDPLTTEPWREAAREWQKERHVVVQRWREKRWERKNA